MVNCEASNAVSVLSDWDWYGERMKNIFWRLRRVTIESFTE